MGRPKSRAIKVAGKEFLVDRDNVPLVWPVIVELFENNDKNQLTDAEIAQVITKMCRKDFPTATVRIYRHKYNRGDYHGGTAPEKRSIALSRVKGARLKVAQVRSLRTLVKMQQSCAVQSGKGSAGSASG